MEHSERARAVIATLRDGRRVQVAERRTRVSRHWGVVTDFITTTTGECIPGWQVRTLEDPARPANTAAHPALLHHT